MPHPSAAKSREILERRRENKVEDIPYQSGEVFLHNRQAHGLERWCFYREAVEAAQGFVLVRFTPSWKQECI